MTIRVFKRGDEDILEPTLAVAALVVKGSLGEKTELREDVSVAGRISYSDDTAVTLSR